MDRDQAAFLLDWATNSDSTAAAYEGELSESDRAALLELATLAGHPERVQNLLDADLAAKGITTEQQRVRDEEAARIRAGGLSSSMFGYRVGVKLRIPNMTVRTSEEMRKAFARAAKEARRMHHGKGPVE